MGKHLVLAGGGHAHMSVLTRLHEFAARGHRVTLVSPLPFHYYSGMGPGLLGGTYRPAQVRFAIRKMVTERGGRFVEDEVVRIDADRRVVILASGAALAYDVLSCNVGSRVPAEKVAAAGPGIVPVKPIDHLAQARQAILEALKTRSLKLLVVGGGPAGAELAGNLRRLVQGTGSEGAGTTITLVAGHRLLGGLPERVRQLALASLAQRQVAVLEGVRVEQVRDGRAALDSGNSLAYDFAFLALGIEPPSLFRDSGLPTGADGGLLVDEHLQGVGQPGIFGGGDCISFQPRPLDKVGVYAVRQGPVLLHNLLAALEGRQLEVFKPQAAYLLIFNLGDGRGIFRRRGWVWDGRPAFWLKDRIDRRFMRKFQLAGEADAGP
jgi:NADH dehydrogenase FAD-containing subunit